MGRIGRADILYKGCFAHVISRSIRKLKLFNDHTDFMFFKNLLLQSKQKAGFKVYHYCLMQTHFHLVVQMGSLKDFSSGIRDVKRAYAYKFHLKYRISGPIWRERFKSLLIENSKYLSACGEYIENNPVKAGLVKQGADWAYSSRRHYEFKESDDLVDSYEKDFERNDVMTLDQEEFESGNIIGSSFFKYQFFENRKQSRRVP